MCVHRRLIFDCVHQAWLGISQLCEAQQAYERGTSSIACNQRWTHGFDTIRIQSKCLECVKRQKKDESKLGAVKGQIQALKEQLRLIKGDTKIKEEEWLSMDSVLQKPKKGTTNGDDDASNSSLEDGTPSSSLEDRNSGSSLGDRTSGSSLEGTRDPSDDGCQPRDKVGLDPEHRPFGLSLKIAERKAIEGGDAKGAAVCEGMLDCMLELRYGKGWTLTRKLKKPLTSTAY